MSPLLFCPCCVSRLNPPFLYINDWNEWTAGKYSRGEGQTTDFMRRKSNYSFVDQYNPEFNRCIHPMRGGYTDNYYMQMAQNIRRYKGARPLPVNTGAVDVAVDGAFDDWKAVAVEYRDTAGDTTHRDHKGYGGLHYTNTSGRNDIVTCKAAVNAAQVAFLAETAAGLTPHTDPNWMLLLVDADQNHDTGWFGYDLLVNRKVVDEKTTTVERWDAAAGAWADAATVPLRYAGKSLELALPRDLFGPAAAELAFDFHWCDNPAELKDPISLCTDGDSAPNRRFNYRFLWKAE